MYVFNYSIFLIFKYVFNNFNGKLVYINNHRMLPRKAPDYIVFEVCVSESFISVVDWIAKTLQRFPTYQSPSNSLCRKLVLLGLSAISDDILKVTSLAMSVVGLNLSSFEPDKFTFTL